MKGFENMTEAEVLQKFGRKTVVKSATMPIAGPTGPNAGRSKYGATKTMVDGIQFDSAKESRRYQELLNLSRVGQVRALRVQPHYTLCALVVDGADTRDVNAGAIVNRRTPVCEYVADFEFEEPRADLPSHWRVVVEDVKSVATKRKEVYRLKRKLFEAQYGVKIRET